MAIKQTKKFIVAITGKKNINKQLSIITYLSPVFFCESADEAIGKAFKFFLERNTGYVVHSHVCSEI